MDLPKCKICGERHRLGGCFKDQAAERRNWLQAMRPVLKDVAGPARVEPVATVTHLPMIPANLGRPFTPDDMKQETMPVTKQRFDRNGYQRELMRRRRALKVLV